MACSKTHVIQFLCGDVKIQSTLLLSSLTTRCIISSQDNRKTYWNILLLIRASEDALILESGFRINLFLSPPHSAVLHCQTPFKSQNLRALYTEEKGLKFSPEGKKTIWTIRFQEKRLTLYDTDSRIIGEILVSIELIKLGSATAETIFAKWTVTRHRRWSWKINPRLSLHIWS